MVLNRGIDLVELILDRFDLRLKFSESGLKSLFLCPQSMILFEKGRDVARRSASGHDAGVFVCRWWDDVGVEIEVAF